MKHTITWDEALARIIKYEKDTLSCQLLSEHLENVSLLAAQFGSKFGSSEILRVAGLYHDFGKVRAEFQEYLKRGNANERGSERHSIYGAKLAYDKFTSIPYISEILGNCIAAHHGQLSDNLAPDGNTPLLDELTKASPAAASLTTPAIRDIDVVALKKELDSIFNNVPPDEDKAFYASMFIKLVYSCLIDADRMDAYLFETGGCFAQEPEPDWGTMLGKLEHHLSRSEYNDGTEMSRLRQSISDACAKSGLREKGIYKLEAPTGGGKTLSSLRFALEHTRKHGMDRIIYVIPYLSILSQAADEIRQALGISDANDTTVLEHHSNFLPDKPEYYKLHTDRWDSPIILTTQVQFLESIFSAKGSDLRKLHNMSRSILIFDEVQSLPIKCVHLFNGAVNFLHRICGSTVLLCTATQPLLDMVERPVFFAANSSIADHVHISNRYKIVPVFKQAGYSHRDLAEFVMDKHLNPTLVIVNTKASAKKLFDELKSQDMPVLHLSTNMCSAHRDDVIRELRCRLEENKPVICVSTQLIEAGVDISFECVVRSVAGLDSIYQAAGRCNRHGEFGEEKCVYVVNIAGENLDKLPDIKIGAEITRRLFDDGNIDINEYYKHYFHSRDQKLKMHCPLSGGKSGSVYDLLSINVKGRESYKRRSDKRGVTPPALLSAIRSAAEGFFVIDRGRTEVVVPYGESDELIARYCETDDVVQRCELLRRLGKYSVSLYEYQLNELERCHALHDRKGIYELSRGFYDTKRGVDINGNHEFLCI